MDVWVELTEDDLLGYARTTVLRNPSARRALRQVILASGAVAVGIVLWTDLPVWLAIAIGLALAPLAVLEMWRNTKREVRRTIADHQGLLGQHHIELLPEGLRERTAVNDTLTAWVAITGVERHEDALYITLGPAAAHVLPLRCFESTAQADAFAAEVERYVAAARSGVGPVG